MKRLLAIQTLLLAISFSAAHGQSDPATTAKRAALMLDSAASALEDAQKSSDRIAALTQTVRAYEEGLAALREGVRRATIRERVITLSFEAKKDRLSRLLGVLQTIGRSPAPLLMMHPSGPMGTARSGMILSDVAPALQIEALELKAQLEDIALMRSLQEGASKQLAKALDEIQIARSALSKAVADRIDPPARIASDPDQMVSLLKAADTLEGFADGLSQLGNEAFSNPADFEGAKGSIPKPVTGTLLTGFNEPDAQGLTRPGITMATPSRALVSAPWSATVRYAGPLLNYGNVVILEPGQRYLMILAGVGELLVEGGQIVSQGDAIALMSGKLADAHSFLMAAAKGGGGNRQESLYIEVREGNTPTNPADWFVADKE